MIPLNLLSPILPPNIYYVFSTKIIEKKEEVKRERDLDTSRSVDKANYRVRKTDESPRDRLKAKDRRRRHTAMSDNHQTPITKSFFFFRSLFVEEQKFLAAFFCSLL